MQGLSELGKWIVPLGYAIIIFYWVFIAFTILSYLFFSIGLFYISKKRFIPHAFLSFIPFASLYQYGELSELSSRKKSVLHPGIILMFLFLATLAVTKGIHPSSLHSPWALYLLLLHDSIPIVYRLFSTYLFSKVIRLHFKTSLVVFHSIVKFLFPLYGSIILFYTGLLMQPHTEPSDMEKINMISLDSFYH